MVLYAIEGTDCPCCSGGPNEQNDEQHAHLDTQVGRPALATVAPPRCQPSPPAPVPPHPLSPHPRRSSELQKSPVTLFCRASVAARFCLALRRWHSSACCLSWTKAQRHVNSRARIHLSVAETQRSKQHACSQGPSEALLPGIVGSWYVACRKHVGVGVGGGGGVCCDNSLLPLNQPSFAGCHLPP